MNDITLFLKNYSPEVQALLATTFTWLLTALGASVVFFFKTINQKALDTMLGFTGGVMVAASFWSLLNPAIEMSSEGYWSEWLPATIGFALGALFLYILNLFIPHLHLNMSLKDSEGPKSNLSKTMLLILAITIHNIPEGLAVGVAFGAAAAGFPDAEFAAAIVLAIGIALQNFPEGVAVSVPMRRQGMSRRKSFFYGQLSGIVEPIAGFIGAVAVIQMKWFLPYALAFAAGAMIYIVVEEVVPESQANKHKNASTLGFIGGFIVMMILDVSLA